MPDNWTKLKWRLQAIAKNEADGGCSGVVLVAVKVFLLNSYPVIWYKPQREPLEPKGFDVSLLPFTIQGNNWDRLINELSGNIESGMIDRTLVVKDGKPIGWLDSDKWKRSIVDNNTISVL